MTVTAYDLATLVPRHLRAREVLNLLVAVRDALRSMDAESVDFSTFDRMCREIAAEKTVPTNDLFHVLRVALSWPEARPGLFELVDNVGPQEALRRLGKAILRLTDVA